MKTTVSKTQIETEKIASDFSKVLVPKDVVRLYGTLGAGKTVFVRGIVAGLGGSTSDVASPTFTLVKEYECGNKRFPEIQRIYHVDLYRIRAGDEVDLGFEEMASDENGVVVVEWAERLSVKSEGYAVRIDHLADDSREIKIEKTN